MNISKKVDEVLKTKTIEERYLMLLPGWLHFVNKHRCLRSGKIPRNPVVLPHDRGLYEREVLQSIIDDHGGFFESPKTGDMIQINVHDLEPTPATEFIQEFISEQFQVMSEFKGLRYSTDQEKLLELLCTKGSVESDELEMREYAIKKIIFKNPSVVLLQQETCFGVRANNLLELMCKFPLVQNAANDNRCIRSDRFYSTIQALKDSKPLKGKNGSLFSQLRHQMLRQTGRDRLAQGLRDRLSDLLSAPEKFDIEKIKILQSCGASLSVSSSGGLSLLYKALNNDLYDVIEIFLRSERLPIQELQPTFLKAVKKINLSTTKNLIQVLYLQYELAQRNKEHVQLNMSTIVEEVVKNYLENQGGEDEPKWRERVDLIINLLSEKERVEILNSTVSFGGYGSMPYAWHAVNAKTIWLLDCLLSNGARFYVENDLKNSAMYRAVELGDDLKLELMFHLVRVIGMNNLCAGNFFIKENEETLLRAAYSIRDAGARECVYRTLFAAGVRYHTVFPILPVTNNKLIKTYYESVQSEYARGIRREHDGLKNNRYIRGTFVFPDTEIDDLDINDDEDNEEKEYEAHQAMLNQGRSESNVPRVEAGSSSSVTSPNGCEVPNEGFDSKGSSQFNKRHNFYSNGSSVVESVREGGVERVDNSNHDSSSARARGNSNQRQADCDAKHAQRPLPKTPNDSSRGVSNEKNGDDPDLKFFDGKFY